MLYQPVNAQEQDTTWKKIHFRGTAACSITGQHNWNGNSDGSIALTGGTDLRFRRRKGIHFSDHRFRGELAFLRISGEEWIKSNDQLKLTLTWFKNPAPGWRNGFSIRFNTQWLSSWKANPETGKQEWYGGCMNPFTMDASYDFTRPLFKNSRMMVSIATLTVCGIPPGRYTSNPGEALIITSTTYIRSRYGCSIQLLLDESFYDNIITLDNQSAMVINSISAEGVRMDIQNRVGVRILKYLQLRLDTRLLYDPLYSNKLQYRQEVLLGIFYDAGK